MMESNNYYCNNRYSWQFTNYSSNAYRL